jgi:hypothetical protein
LVLAEVTGRQHTTVDPEKEKEKKAGSRWNKNCGNGKSGLSNFRQNTKYKYFSTFAVVEVACNLND